MFVCDDGSLPFLAPVILPNCVFPPGFPPYLNAGSTQPITVHFLTSTQPVVKLMENFLRE